METDGQTSAQQLGGSEPEGATLYALYLKIFGTAFTPKWPELSEISQAGWARLEREHRTVARVGGSYAGLAPGPWTGTE